MNGTISPNVKSPGALSIERVHGALLGAAMGDALGWPYEQNSGRVGSTKSGNAATLLYVPWYRRGGGRFQPYEEEIEAGAYSDDTQLILATARSLMRGEAWRKCLAFHEIPLWLSYERGGGGATKRAAESRRNGAWPWQDPKLHDRYFEAGGNGVAMRVLPHVLIPEQTEQQLLRDVFRNGIITHGHPRALLGARVYAQAAWWISRTPRPLPFGSVVDAVLDAREQWSKTPEYTDGTDNTATYWLESADKHFPGGYIAAWGEVVREILEGLELCRQTLMDGALANDSSVLRELRCFDRKVNGSGVIAALASLYLFAAHAADPIIGVRTIAFARSADTDTLASMLGGLYGLCHGLDWIPEPLRQIQDRDLISRIANQLIQLEPVSAGTIMGQWGRQNEEELRKQLLQREDEHIKLGILGDARIAARKMLKSRSPGLTVTQWQLVTAEGQTVYIKQLKKETASQEKLTSKGQQTGQGQLHRKEANGFRQPELFSESDNNSANTEPSPRDRQSSEFSRAGELLAEAVPKFALDSTSTAFLWAIIDAMRVAPLTRDKIRELRRTHEGELSSDERELYAYLLEKYLGPTVSGDVT